MDLLRSRLKTEIVRLTRYQPSEGSLDATILEQVERDGYRLVRLRYKTGPGRLVAALLAEPAPDRSRRKTILFVDERGKAAADADITELARLGYTVLAVDPSGIGEIVSKWPGYSESWFGQEKTAWLALMVGRPLIGLRMDDILRGVDLLRERGLLYGGECLLSQRVPPRRTCCTPRSWMATKSLSKSLRRRPNSSTPNSSPNSAIQTLK